MIDENEPRIYTLIFYKQHTTEGVNYSFAAFSASLRLLIDNP